MMGIKQLSVFVENRPGAVSKVCKALSAGGVNLAALSLADTAQFGVLRMLLGDSEKAVEVLRKAGVTARLVDVTAVRVPDEPGGLSKVMEVFDRLGLVVDYMYAAARNSRGKAVLVFRLSGDQAAIGRLAQENVDLVTGEEFAE
ncbi:MAG: hypothetical protein MJ025_02885 [Victivallaceae bacterium]|nr:hypothetical protein [Victivallaceae bacterium]